jgi:CubicO group peptidase (beta-lactamase class C family)
MQPLILRPPCGAWRPSRYHRSLSFTVTLLAVARLANSAALPAEIWRPAAPESAGFSATKLEAWRTNLAGRDSKALLVIRRDAIVCEWYAPDHGAAKTHYTASLAKALFGGLSLAVALSDGRLALDDPAAKYLPSWASDSRKSRITLRHLGSHTSGIDDAEADGLPHDKLTGWKGDFWKRRPVPEDPFTLAHDRAPLRFEPGEQMQYSNPGIALLTWCVTAAFRDAPQPDIRSLLRERIMRPLGVPEAEWSAGYGQTFTVDGLPLVPSWGGGACTARAAARVGRLMLRQGDWEGQRLLNAEAVRLTTADAGTPGPCGIGWWSNQEGDCEALPRDAFFGSGAGHQILLVVPSLDLVVVRFGSLLEKVGSDPQSFHGAYCRHLFEPLMAALTDAPADAGPRRTSGTEAAPYPPSPVIAQLEWAPREKIVRQAPGSDNWPLTWADDDALYSAYGDGRGFAPFTPEKLSLGFARLTGGPADFVGVNLRSPTGEALGDGARGRKASGLLSLDGTLWLLARNAGNAQLAWSTDHGTTWSWADWKFTTSFGCPTFLNSGRDYAGARDDFVYLYSPDGESAYEPADQMVLARVPKERLRDRDAYEFFVRLDTVGDPVWSKDITHRGAVFRHPGRCYRSGITFNPALQRYLWVQILPESRHPQGPRFQGGFGVYDAPEPWGPWSTTFFTEDWDVGPGETASFPAKWMSADGRTLHLVFSGEDSFSVRSAALTLRSSPSTRVTLRQGQWLINDRPTNVGSAAEGLLMNVRMVNAVFEDRARPDFDPEANTARFIARLPDYAAAGVNAFTICLQGGMPGYEGAVNSAFEPDGSLRPAYLARVERVIRACDREGQAVILGLFYQRQSAVLRDETAVRAGVVNAAGWVRDRGFANVLLEIANEYPHGGFVHAVIREPEGQASLIRLARETAPGLLVSASGYGDGAVHREVAAAADFLLPHWNGTRVEQIAARLRTLNSFGKPVVCNEDDKTGAEAVAALHASVANGAGYGLMLKDRNQTFPFRFEGPADDPVFYAALRALTTPDKPPAASNSDSAYFPPPESHGGWRKLEAPDDIRRLAGMDPGRLEELRQWLLESDRRGFAAVVIRRGQVVLEVERGNSAKTDSRRVASVSKAVCATVLAIAAEQSQQGHMPRRMTFDDPAFGFIPWAEPLSDPRKARITVRQLLNHTSGICPEATGAPNDGSWEYILGHTGDARTAKLAFDPGTGCGYSTHALAHAALVCETVTGKPYDVFAIEALFRPLGIEHWWFQYYDGGERIGRHPSHGLGLPARDLARIAYCLLRGGRWGEQQVVPAWFVTETAAPTHDVTTPELRWQLNPQVFSHGWELPARHRGEGGRSGGGIPADARSKPGSGGQLIAFVPSLDLVVTRQTGSSGDWQFEEYLRRACAAVLPESAR